MPYQPPHTISHKILSLVAQISESVALASLSEIHNSPQLRRENRIKTITGTLAIEGNTLSLEQVSAIIEGKLVRGSQKEIAEVRGAIKAYEALLRYKPYSPDDLLDAHKKMTEEILPDAGRFRSGNVGIHKGDKLIHVAPQANRVHSLMQDLLHWLEHTENHPLISSCVFHYEFEFIHPFSDGNGRMGRLWQTLILGQWREIFYSLPIENVVKNNQRDYYKALGEADKAADSTVFIEFMLSIILASFTMTDPATDPATDPVTDPVTDQVTDQATDQATDPVTDQVTDQATDPVKKLLSVMGNGYLTSAQIMAKLSLSHKHTFRNNYLLPALKQGFISMSYPDTPNNPKQKYRKKK